MIIKFIFLLLLTPGLYAQEFLLDIEKSQLKISGTSTVHDWTAEAKNFSSKLMIAPDKPIKITKLSLRVPVKSIKSDSDKMNQNIYIALKEEKFPSIFFNLERASLNEKSEFIAQGVLSIAGENNEVKIKGVLTKLSTQLIQIKGQYQLTMKEYKVVPPTFLFGMMSTGDKVIIDFNFFYQSWRNNS